jgi:chromosome segregation ATPase
MNNGKDENGRTNALNPNFVRLQDLVAAPFADMGFERGESKLVTGRDHEVKEQFVLSKLKAKQQENDVLQQKCEALAQQLDLLRAEQVQLAEQIVEQKNEAASWAAEIQKMKDQFHHLQQLIKQRAVAAVRQFAARLNQLTSASKPTLK